MAAELLELLNNPRRRELLRLCWDEPRQPSALHGELSDVTLGAISQHLRRLHDAGLLEVERDGRRRFYRTKRTALGPLRRWLERTWDDALYRLKLEAELEASRRGPRPGQEEG